MRKFIYTHPIITIFIIAFLVVFVTLGSIALLLINPWVFLGVLAIVFLIAIGLVIGCEIVSYFIDTSGE